MVEEKKRTGRKKQQKASQENDKEIKKDAVTETVEEVIVGNTEATEVETEAVEVTESEDKKPARGKKGNRRGGAGNKALEIELEKQKELAEESSDKYKRLLAEFENARNRNEKESRRMYDIGAKEVLERLLPVVDNFERALQAIPEEDKDRAFEQGVDKIYRQLIVTLDELGVQPMNAEGAEFNPDFHNAVMHVEDDAFGENIVAEELQKGYMYKEEVLRYSMVKVAN